ncbi:MAG: hypothetical protein ACM3S1_05320 [Hyphomicrobiales bacterium]
MILLLLAAFVYPLAWVEVVVFAMRRQLVVASGLGAALVVLPGVLAAAVALLYEPDPNLHEPLSKAAATWYAGVAGAVLGELVALPCLAFLAVPRGESGEDGDAQAAGGESASSSCDFATPSDP